MPSSPCGFLLKHARFRLSRPQSHAAKSNYASACSLALARDPCLDACGGRLIALCSIKAVAKWQGVALPSPRTIQAAGAGLISSYIPARRAMRLDLLTALRED